MARVFTRPARRDPSTAPRGPSMRSTWLGRLIGRFYGVVPFRRMLMTAVAAAEGGTMLSLTVRSLLEQYHGVTAGPYSYGSLLQPGQAHPGTAIGSYVSIGPNVLRLGADHPLDHPSTHPLWYNPRLGLVDRSHDVERNGCVIGSDAWIGANVVILPSCRSIGVGAVIGANAVVRDDVPPFEVWAGVPARRIRSRLTGAQREAVAALDWTAPPEVLRARLAQIAAWDQ